MNPIRLMLVDDHKIVRDGIKSILQGEGNFEIAAEAESGIEALELLSTLIVDIALVDINMPGMNGIELTKQISQNHENVKVCGLSMVSEKEHINQMILNGAKGYLLKSTGKEDLLNALESISKGGTFFCSDLREIFPEAAKEPEEEKDSMAENFSFSEKEELILGQLAQSGTLTSELLSLNQKTTDIFIKNLLRKTNSSNLSQLASFAKERSGNKNPQKKPEKYPCD